jgi:ribosomal protein S18 acetylase RimI-like enzyme
LNRRDGLVVDDAIVIKVLDDEAILKIVDMDCSPLPNERDSIYLNFYRFFKDTCWVAFFNDELIGFVLGFIDQTNKEHGYMNYLFVKSEYRRRGVGARLIRAFELSAQEKGCKLISLLTGKIENINYYRSQGFYVNHNLTNWTQADAVYDYYFNKKKVSLLVKNLYGGQVNG